MYRLSSKVGQVSFLTAQRLNRFFLLLSNSWRILMSATCSTDVRQSDQKARNNRNDERETAKDTTYLDKWGGWKSQPGNRWVGRERNKWAIIQNTHATKACLRLRRPAVYFEDTTGEEFNTKLWNSFRMNAVSTKIRNRFIIIIITNSQQWQKTLATVLVWF